MRRTILEEILQYIKFDELSLDDLCTFIQPKKVLTEQELLAYFEMASSGKRKKPPIPLLTKRTSTSNLFRDTALLEPLHQALLNKYTKRPHGTRWKLVYRGSRDGMTSSTFLHRCSSIQPTLLVIQSHQGNVFGGFTTKRWAGTGYKMDEDAKIFSLVNSRKIPYRLDSNNGYQAINAMGIQTGSGPSFGNCLRLSANFYALDNNYARDKNQYRIGKEFEEPLGIQNGEEPLGLLASPNFIVQELEVFTTV